MTLIIDFLCPLKLKLKLSLKGKKLTGAACKHAQSHTHTQTGGELTSISTLRLPSSAHAGLAQAERYGETAGEQKSTKTSNNTYGRDILNIPQVPTTIKVHSTNEAI